MFPSSRLVEEVEGFGVPQTLTWVGIGGERHSSSYLTIPPGFPSKDSIPKVRYKVSFSEISKKTVESGGVTRGPREAYATV